jgi:hypothetical protein
MAKTTEQRPVRIFRVKFEEKWTAPGRVTEGGGWDESESLDVEAADAEQAWAKVKKHAMSADPIDMDDGRKMVIRGARLLGVEFIVEADL